MCSTSAQIMSHDFGIDHLESAGLHIYTTLDLNLQNEVQASIWYNYIKSGTITNAIAEAPRLRLLIQATATRTMAPL